MTSGVLKCADGEVQIATDGAPLCSGTWTLVPVPEPFELSQIDPVHASMMFGLGFSLILPIWWVSRCAKAVLNILQ
ncbi:hypothetical protein N7403_31940 [Pseudomonas nitroreducens]|uniref:hypothetical protein n=1 Tax=Pseudomonas nitroreducens TaxID=46680 RepID=UPI00244C93FA|nr:hypothetical protein [Pseudomonas nitroreducens]MDG9858486.1 hypothetical protein [Pseudomonas nitroreducens]